MKDDQFVFLLLLHIHRKLGPITKPIVAVKDGKRYFIRDYLSRLTIDTYQEELPPPVSEIIQLFEEFSDSNLARQFAPRNTTPVDFLKRLDEPLFSMIVRPFIEKKVSAILHLAYHSGISVYLDEGSNILYPEKKLTINHEPADPWFHFTKTEAGSTYVLEVKTDTRSLRLNDQGNLLVTNLPCWFVSRNRLYHFIEPFNGKRLKPFLTKEIIHIPLSAEKKYFETFVANDLKSGNVTAEGFEVSDLNIWPELELSIEEDWQGRAVFIIRFYYGDHVILAGKKQKVFTNLNIISGQYSFTRIYRNQEKEHQMIHHLLNNGLIQLNENTLSIAIREHDHLSSMYQLISWINEHTSLISEIPARILQRTKQSSFFLGSIGLDLNINFEHDWFDINSFIRFGEYSVPFVHLKDYILNDIHSFILPNGETVILPNEWFVKTRNLFLFGQTQDGRLRLQKRYYTVAREVSSWYGKIPLDTISFDISTIPLSVPENLNFTLRDYQMKGLHWMLFLNHHQFGGCLADDMGLGKTVQTIALLLWLKEHKKSTSLIVMQASLIYNWKRELEKFAPTLSVLIHTGYNRPKSTQFFSSFDVVLSTYGTVRNDIELLSGFEFSYVILDESQVIKNPEAKVSLAVQKLNCNNRLVLTGTPIENSLTDLWSQMNFLNPGLLSDLPSFQKEYQHVEAGKEDDPGISRLQCIIKPFLLRRKKSEVEPELPPLTQEVIYCEMTEEHRQVYETERSAIRRQVLENINAMNATYDSISVLRSLVRLRQLANHPLLVDPDYHGDSGKFEEIINNLEILAGEGQKVLVFSSFVKHLKLISNYLDANGKKYAMLTGATTKRAEVVDEFQNNPNCLFFLISLKAGGTGLNLTEAGYVFILDPWWNPAAELQAINRAHRIGQDKKVLAYRFICKDTIEEKIVRLQEKKQALFDTFIQSANPLKGMTKAEVLELFGN